jgi:polyhydroxybutyrate depolymerase
MMPPNLDPAKPAPLLLELHEYVDAGTSMTPWLDEENANQLGPEAAKRGVILVLPHGSFDSVLNHFFWNATDGCCDLEMAGSNDIGYLMAVIQAVQAMHPIDPKRIFAFGHGNGAFMVNRMACDQADKIAAVVSVAGETYKDQSRCAASAPIAFLEVQGDADLTIPYPGGSAYGITTLPAAPGAIETTQDWVAKNRCSPQGDTKQPPIKLMTTSANPDTNKIVFASQCEGTGQTELWTIHLGPHSPPFSAAWAPAVLDFLMSHPKP